MHSLEIKCPQTNDLSNGIISYSSEIINGSYSFGTVATFSCSPGFGLNGLQSRKCVNGGNSTTGVFSGDDPNCTGMYD